MSNAVQCDTCQAVQPAQSEALIDWLHIEWGTGSGKTGFGCDYCTYDCAHAGLSAERDADAKRAAADAEVA